MIERFLKGINPMHQNYLKLSPTPILTEVTIFSHYRKMIDMAIKTVEMKMYQLKAHQKRRYRESTSFCQHNEEKNPYPIFLLCRLFVNSYHQY